MCIVIITSILACFFTYLDSRHQMRGGMLSGFILLTILGAIHYNYGSDYMAYYELYKEIVTYSFDIETLLLGDIYKEPGWALLCFLFKPIGGFFMMVAVLNVFQNVLVFRIIKTEVKREWWPIAISIYLFNPSFYLLSFSMMRQELAMCIFFGIWPLINARKWLWSLLILLFCTSIHTSSVILLPFAFLGYLPINKRRIIVLLFLLVYLLLWMQKDLLNDFLRLMFISENLSKLEEAYADSDDRVTFGLGYLINMVPFILSMVYLYKCTNVKKFRLVMLSAVGFLIVPFAQIIPLITRLSLYFSIYGIISTTEIYSIIEKSSIRKFLLFVFLFMNIVVYYGYFTSDLYGESYRNFDSIFSVIFDN